MSAPRYEQQALFPELPAGGFPRPLTSAGYVARDGRRRTPTLCPSCSGEGKARTLVGGSWVHHPCGACNGCGNVARREE